MKIWCWRYTGLAIASALTCQFAISACSSGQQANQTTLPESKELATETAETAEPACAPMALE